MYNQVLICDSLENSEDSSLLDNAPIYLVGCVIQNRKTYLSLQVLSESYTTTKSAPQTSHSVQEEGDDGLDLATDGCAFNLARGIYYSFTIFRAKISNFVQISQPCPYQIQKNESRKDFFLLLSFVGIDWLGYLLYQDNLYKNRVLLIHEDEKL